MSNRKMIRVDVHRAQEGSICSDLVPIATIQIHEPFPESDASEPFDSYRTKSRATFDNEAGELCRALIAVLPGGTVDALLVQLLDHRRSLYRVSHDAIGQTTPPTPSRALETARSHGLEHGSSVHAPVIERMRSEISALSAWLDWALADRPIDATRRDREGMDDAAYAALGELVKTLALEMTDGRLSDMVGHIMKAIDKLSPTVGAEVRLHGAKDTYAKRW